MGDKLQMCHPGSCAELDSVLFQDLVWDAEPSPAWQEKEETEGEEDIENNNVIVKKLK